MAQRIETRGRARALQALYAWDVRRDIGLTRAAQLVWDDLSVPPEERAFAEALINLLATDMAGLDAALGEVTTRWRLDRLGAIERCVLRLGAAELAQGGTPAKVVIQECVKLAERYGTARSAGFVNGVLDAHARRMGALA
ncbi:MAG: transcription antitermination factor NusB [Gemmatimonadaceae bacterium]|nr:transcription antitermination factor NusB [Gemmatimonadaceae bacterium]